MYTFLTVLHVVVCVFLMLVVLLQAGRGGGIGLAFGGSGGSQSVFGSSGGANFLTKMTAVCAVIFFTNSLALAYMSSQSDSRRLQKIAEKKSLAKKAEDATNAKMLTDIEKQRAEQAKAAAQKSEAVPSGEPAEGAPAEEKAQEKAQGKSDDSAAAKVALPKPTPSLQLKLPEASGGKAAPAGAGKLTADLKLNKAEKLAATTPEKTEKAEKKAAVVAPAPKKKAVADQPAADDQPAAVKKPAAGKKTTTEETPAAEDKPAVEKKPAKKPAAEKKSDEPAAEKPAAE